MTTGTYLREEKGKGRNKITVKKITHKKLENGIEKELHGNISRKLLET